MMRAVQRIVEDKFTSRQLGCYPETLWNRNSLVPPWHDFVADAITSCESRMALKRTPELQMGFSRYTSELRRPSAPMGRAAATFWEILSSPAASSGSRTKKAPKELCILMPVTDASPKHVHRARAVADTWAKSYFAEGREEGDVIARFYSLRPLLPEWEGVTLSLPGDLDLRHSKFNSLRILYMWAAVAAHLAGACKFFMKADVDSYIDMPTVLEHLRKLDGFTDPVYAGCHYGPGPSQ